MRRFILFSGLLMLPLILLMGCFVAFFPDEGDYVHEFDSPAKMGKVMFVNHYSGLKGSDLLITLNVHDPNRKNSKFWSENWSVSMLQFKGALWSRDGSVVAIVERARKTASFTQAYDFRKHQWVNAPSKTKTVSKNSFQIISPTADKQSHFIRSLINKRGGLGKRLAKDYGEFFAKSRSLGWWESQQLPKQTQFN